MKKNVVLAAALIALMAVGVFAQTEADFVVRKSANGKSVTIVEYKGNAAVVNIPEKIQNLPVIIIDQSAFAQNKNITSVIIPDSVTSIGGLAFQECEKLTSVIIGNRVTKIEYSAFIDCASLTSVTFSGVIASGSFHSRAFIGLGDIRDKFYATDNFRGTPGTYTRNKGELAWTRGALAASAQAYAGTAGLEFIAINNNKGYSVSTGTVTTGAVVIPATYNNLPVTAVADNAFNRTQITAVTIPDSVTAIGNNAFSSCAELKNVTMGNKLASIGDGAFARSGITSITIPANVGIASNAFALCRDLSSVTFQGTSRDTRLGANTFSGIGNLLDRFRAGGAGTYTRSGASTAWTKQVEQSTGSASER